MSVLNEIFHGLDTMEIAVIGLVNHTPATPLKGGTPMSDDSTASVGPISRSNGIRSMPVIEHAGAKRRIDNNGVKHGNIAMVGIDARAPG